jgi:hypothetical protein
MKKLLLLCTMVATLAGLTFAQNQVNRPANEAAKERYHQLYDKVANGTATYAESVEFGDLSKVLSLEVPVVSSPEPENRDRSSLDGGSPDCATATVISACPYSDTGNFDGDNDCSIPAAAPYNEVFYTFTPGVTGGFTMRVRSYGTIVPGIRVVLTACCTGATSPPTWSYSGATPVDISCSEPANVVTYLYVYLTAGVQYWIHVGTNANNALLSAYDFNLWCVPPCPPMEPNSVHNTCATAWQIACGDSIMGDSASAAAPDWFKVVVPDLSPQACSLRVFVGGDELGHCISGRYPGYPTPVPLGYPNGRFTLYKDGVPCGTPADSVGFDGNSGCSLDAVKTIAVDPGTYYIKVWNNTLNEYVLTTKCIPYNPIAACCFVDGSCQDLVSAACAAAGGWSKAIGVLCASLPCPTSACPGGALDNESVNNVCGSAVPQVFCNSWYCGVINPKTDVDWYQLILAEGVCESLVVDVFGNATPSKWPFGQGLNPFVYLYAADCATVLASNDNNSGVDPDPVGNDSRIKRVLKPGTYYIKVTSASSLTSGPYLMHVNCPPRGCLPGDFCSNAVAISALPYTDAGKSTCWYLDDYRPTCLVDPTFGNLGGGPDVIYTIELDGNTCITCSLTTNTFSFGSVSLYAQCPTNPAEPCLAKSAGSYSGPYGFTCQGLTGPLPAGTYYIMVDNLSGCIDNYTLKVSTCDCPYPCDTYTLCGSPGETEPNNTCPPPAGQAEITCDTTVYGLHCPNTDNDFWKVTVAPMSVMTIKVFTGTNCDVNPAAGVLFGYYDDLCANPRLGMATSVMISNPTANPVVKYLVVYDTGLSQRLYKIEATCCTIRDYCADPIVTGTGVYAGGVFTYDSTVNTCCATNVVDTVGSTGCATGQRYESGPDVVFKFILASTNIVSISANSVGSGNGQFSLFTDCANPKTSCVMSQDATTGTTPEVANNLVLPGGTYYVSVSQFGTTACGVMHLHIASDCPLPVNLAGDVVATAGNEKVTLSWATASETDNDRFEIVRNGRMIGHVAGAGTSPSRHDYAWSEEGLNNGMTYTYTLRTVDINGQALDLATVSATPNFAAGEVSEYSLHQNYPNPFNPVTTIAFDLPDAGNVSLKIYNLFGQEVRTVVSGTLPQGRHVVSFNAGDLSSGVYLYRIEVNGFAAEKKMLLMK